MSVNVNGTVTLTGKLADHTMLTASAPLSKANQWPVFSQLYSLQGCLAGNATLTDADDVTDDVTATQVSWFRPYQSTQWYPDGWSDGIKIDLKGARYNMPLTGSVFTGLLAPTPNATLTFTNGLLTAPINKDITISPLNLVTNAPAALTPTLIIAKASGLITGSFTHSDTTKPTYQGVIMQKGPLKGAHGYFMTTTPKVLTYLGESGKVSVLAK